MYSNPPMNYSYHTPSFPYHSTIDTTPITPSFPSFPWELFTPYYTHVGSSSPNLYPNHGYSPHIPNPYPSYSITHPSYSYVYPNRGHEPHDDPQEQLLSSQQPFIQQQALTKSTYMNNYYPEATHQFHYPKTNYQFHYQEISSINLAHEQFRHPNPCRVRRDFAKQFLVSHPCFKKSSKKFPKPPLIDNKSRSNNKPQPGLFNRRKKMGSGSRRGSVRGRYNNSGSSSGNPNFRKGDSVAREALFVEGELLSDWIPSSSNRNLEKELRSTGDEDSLELSKIRKASDVDKRFYELPDDPPTTITNAEGQRTTQSVVAYTKNDDRLVGQIAKRQAVVNPENTFLSLKRFIGRKMFEVGDKVFDVLFTSGDTHLGGDDFEKRVVDWMAGIDLLKDKEALQRLIHTAEKAKMELSSLTQTNISLLFITATSNGPKHIETTLTRAEFEDLFSDLLDRLRTPVENLLRDEKLSIQDINEVILVGGSTCIPAVQELVKKLIRKDSNVTVNSNEVVPLGAAVQAGVLARDVSNIALLNVSPLSLGLETLGGVPLEANKFASHLWGDYYNPNTRALKKKPHVGGGERSFVEFVLEPLYNIYSQVIGEHKKSVDTTLAELGVTLSNAAYRLNVRPLLRLACSSVFGSASGFLDMPIQHIPSPRDAAVRKFDYIYTGPKSLLTATTMISARYSTLILFAKIIFITSNLMHLMGFELKKLILLFTNMLLTVILVFDPGRNHLRHCRVGDSGTLTENTLHIINSIDKIIADFLLFCLVDANSKLSKALLYNVVKGFSTFMKTIQSRTSNSDPVIVHYIYMEKNLSLLFSYKPSFALWCLNYSLLNLANITRISGKRCLVDCSLRCTLTLSSIISIIRWALFSTTFTSYQLVPSKVYEALLFSNDPIFIALGSTKIIHGVGNNPRDRQVWFHDDHIIHQFPLTVVGINLAVMWVDYYSQPMHALAFAIDGIYYGVSDFEYAAYSMVLAGLISSIFMLVTAPEVGLPGIWAGLFLFNFHARYQQLFSYNLEDKVVFEGVGNDRV